MGAAGIAGCRARIAIFFRPEPGDEVIVGFLNDDPRQAVILGAVYGSKNTPPKHGSQLAKENIKKAIVTKKGTMIAIRG